MKLWIRKNDLEKLKVPDHSTDLVRFYTYKPVYDDAVQIEITEIGAEKE